MPRVPRPPPGGCKRKRRPKQAALARQVRQRMNRLGKPEHRARFCRRDEAIPDPIEIQIPMGFNRSTLNPRSPKNPSPTTALSRRLRHRARRNHHSITPAICITPVSALRHRAPSNHHICRPHRIIAHLGATPLRACAGPEPGSSMPHVARSVCRARRPGDANGNAAQTGGFGAASAARDEPAREARAPRALLLLF